jgi:hypothetical protein
MPPSAPAVAVTLNIAFRPWSRDLILMNSGLAKPIPKYLVYSKALSSLPVFVQALAAARA